MSFRVLKNGLALSVSLLVAGQGHAQAPQIPVLGELLGGLPVVGALGNVAAGVELPGLDGLDGLAALPGLDALGGAGLPGLDALPLPGLEALADVGGETPALSGLLDALPLLSSGTPQLPGVNALLSIVDGAGSGGLPGAEMLPLTQLAAIGSGDLPLPGLDALQIDIGALSDYATLGKVETTVAAVEAFVNAIAENPQSLASFGSDLGPDTLLAMLPLLAAAKDDPASLPTYFSEGGTVVSSEMHLLPPIPVLTQPLDL